MSRITSCCPVVVLVRFSVINLIIACCLLPHGLIVQAQTVRPPAAVAEATAPAPPLIAPNDEMITCLDETFVEEWLAAQPAPEPLPKTLFVKLPPLKFDPEMFKSLNDPAADRNRKKADGAELPPTGAGENSDPASKPPSQFGEQAGFQWRRALRQSLAFLSIQHGFRLLTEQGSRAELKGPFFADYGKSLRSLRGWRDGDPFIVNYVGHPMMGAISGFIQIQNDPQGMKQEISMNKAYWKSRFKAFGFSALYSTQFELGPLSEATIGNIGIRPTKKAKNPMAYVDLVVTPTVGTAWLVGEDTLDRYVVRKLESRTNNRVLVIVLRSILNPSRSFANFLRGNWPWYRDDRQ